MLAIFSDIHLTDESTSVNVNPEAFTSLLGPQIINNSKNNNADEINIIMLGDIFDLVRTDYWLREAPISERPWGGIIDKSTGMNTHHMVETHYGNVLKRIIESDSARGFIRMLKSVKEKAEIPVKLIYVLGNHDRAINNFDWLKENIRSSLAEFKPEEIIFCNVFKDERYATLCRHGHEFDDNNFGFELYKEMNNNKSVSIFNEKVYRVQSIGEPITAELMAGIIYRLKNELGEDNEFVKMILDVNNVRPMSKAILWMYWISSNQKMAKRLYRVSLLEAFKMSLKAVLETPFAKKWDELRTDYILTGDITDSLSKLSRVLEFADFSTIQGFIDVFGFFDKIFGGRRDAVEEGAIKELSRTYNNNIQYLFMGHTHEAKQSCLESTTENSLKLYVNTGTYLPLIQQTLNGKDFSSVHQMTMAFVYNTNEDYNRLNSKPNKFPTLDLWNGIKKKDYTSAINS